MLTELLQTSIDHKASDLHLSVGSPPIIRIDGDLHSLNYPVLTTESLQQLLTIILSDRQQKQYAEGNELDLALHLPQLGRFRVNLFQQNNGIAAAIRIIPHQIKSLLELNLPNVLQTIANFPHGLVLITGATGSGKTTTLAAMIDYINHYQARHILTIEDTIEFLHTNQCSLVQQREVQRDTKSFNAALRSALRADPDIILIGELRDLETIRLALTAAETGHLVFATLHTTSAAKTIHRIVDVCPGEEKTLVRTMLSEALQAVVCQKLIKRNEGGRVAALEIMLCTPAIRNLIREDKIAQIYSMIQTGSALGMQTFEQHLSELKRTQAI
jgi:twitching motility protein PilT